MCPLYFSFSLWVFPVVSHEFYLCFFHSFSCFAFFNKLKPSSSLPVICICYSKIAMWRACNLTAISLHSHHVSLVQWTTCLLPVTRDPGSKPLGGLMWIWDYPVSLSCYIGDPNVIDHFCGLVWGGLRPKPSLGPRANNVINPLDLTQLFCPGFMLAAGPLSSFTTDVVSCWGGALWRACNLTPFSRCLTGPVDYLFASPGGTSVKSGFSC